MSVRLWLPGERPPSWNTYYRGGHWRKRSAEAQRVHELVYWTTRVQLGCEIEPFARPVRITVTVYFKDHPLDASNIPAKLFEDGLVHAGLLVDDNPTYVAGVTTQSRLATDEQPPGVEIIIEEAEEAE